MPLKITDGMGAWIDDFKKSDAPQFKGKSEKERRDMAIAAYLSAKRESVKEATTFEVDIEGLPKMYIKDKSPGAVKAKLRGIVKQPSMIQGVDRVTDAELKKTYRDKAQGREEEDMEEGAKGYKPGWMLKADPKLGAAVKAKQDIEKKRQASYGKPEAGKSVKESSDAYGKSLEKEKEKRLTPNDRDKLSKIRAMMAKEKKPTHEEVELDESWSDGVSMRANAAKHRIDAAKHRRTAESHHAVAKTHEKGSEHHNKNMAAYHTAMAKNIKSLYHAGSYGSASEAKKDHKEHMNAAKHYKSSMSEQVEQIDESDSKQKYKDRAKEAKKAGDHVGYHANMHDYYQGHADARTSGGAGNTIKNMQKARFHKQELQYYRAKAKNATNEEAEQIDELSPNTLKQYHGKAAADLNAKRDKMSKGTLTTTDHKKGQKRVTGLNRAASKMEEVELDENTMTVDIDHTGGHDPVAKKHGIKLKRTGNYSHNATGKKKNLQKYLAHHYDSHSDAKEIHPEVYKEEVEEVNEISKKTLGSYINKATTSVADAGYNSNDQDPARRKRGINTYVKRRKGIDKAVDRLTKESANLDRILSLLSKGDKK